MEIDVQYTQETTYVSLHGGITSSNVEDFSVAMSEEPKGSGGIIIDAHDLEYISSSGLRVILAAKKRCRNLPFQIINVSMEVKNIFDMTGFSEIMDISTVPWEISLEGCELIGAGACGECFRIDDETIIKLYYPRVSREEIEREKELSKKAFVMGVPTAISYDIVESQGRVGVVYELIRSKTLGELIREDAEHWEDYVDMYAKVCKQIHSIEAEDDSLPSFKEINRLDIPNITGISEEDREYLYRFLDLVPDSACCIHGDLNINNLMVQDGECCLIDMGEFSTGLPLFDISRILFSMHFAADSSSDYNAFYKLPQKMVEDILSLFLKKYFECETLEEAQEKDPNVKWLYPLAWFRCCTSLLKGDRWPAHKRQEAIDLFHEKLIPFLLSVEKSK